LVGQPKGWGHHRSSAPGGIRLGEPGQKARLLLWLVPASDSPTTGNPRASKRRSCPWVPTIVRELGRRAFRYVGRHHTKFSGRATGVWSRPGRHTTGCSSGRGVEVRQGGPDLAPPRRGAVGWGNHGSSDTRSHQFRGFFTGKVRGGRFGPAFRAVGEGGLVGPCPMDVRRAPPLLGMDW